MHSLSRNAVLALIGLTLVLHTTEEYLTFPAFLLSRDNPLLAWLPLPGLLHKSQELHVALVLATVLPLLVIAWAILSRRKVLLVAVVLVESVLLVNGFGHILASLVRGSYVPGLITAVLINLPFGVYVFQKAIKEQWIRPGEAWQVIGVAVLLHVAWLISGFWMLRGAAFR
jgi:hypothetical protein